MPAVSKKQQRFMGMVHAAQKGEKPASGKVAKAAKGMTKKASKDFASTSHKGLPEKVAESFRKKLAKALSESGPEPVDDDDVFGMVVRNKLTQYSHNDCIFISSEFGDAFIILPPGSVKPTDEEINSRTGMSTGSVRDILSAPMDWDLYDREQPNIIVLV